MQFANLEMDKNLFVDNLIQAWKINPSPQNYVNSFLTRDCLCDSFSQFPNTFHQSKIVDELRLRSLVPDKGAEEAT